MNAAYFTFLFRCGHTFFTQCVATSKILNGEVRKNILATFAFEKTFYIFYYFHISSVNNDNSVSVNLRRGIYSGSLLLHLLIMSIIIQIKPYMYVSSFSSIDHCNKCIILLRIRNRKTTRMMNNEQRNYYICR